MTKRLFLVLALICLGLFTTFAPETQAQTHNGAETDNAGVRVDAPPADEDSPASQQFTDPPRPLFGPAESQSLLSPSNQGGTFWSGFINGIVGTEAGNEEPLPNDASNTSVPGGFFRPGIGYALGCLIRWSGFGFIGWLLWSRFRRATLNPDDLPSENDTWSFAHLSATDTLEMVNDPRLINELPLPSQETDGIATLNIIEELPTDEIPFTEEISFAPSVADVESVHEPAAILPPFPTVTELQPEEPSDTPDPLAIADLIPKIQAAWSSGDIEELRPLVTPPMLEALADELAANAAKGLVNKVQQVEIKAIEILQSWQAAGMDYTAIRLDWQAIDLMVRLDRTPDNADYIASGDPSTPVTAKEIWTLARAEDDDWQLSAVKPAKL